MHIHWEIIKKRGNHRPVLRYELELESFEVDLAVPRIVLDSAVPKPPSSWRSYCYPGEDERAGAELQWHRIITPGHTKKRVAEALTLPWRDPSDDFTDIREAFERVQRDFELVLKNAYDSTPLDIVEALELTQETRQHIVCGVAKAKFLSVVGF